MASRELSILVTAKNMASRVLNTVKGDVRGINQTAQRASSNVGRNVTLATTALAAGLAVQVRAGVDSLVELERVNNLTGAALESTGNVAGQSVEGIRARSEAMEQLTGVDDKAIQNAQNLLLTFKGVTKDGFEPTLEAALNLNAAMGGDDDSLQGVLIQVGKAMNDPMQGLTALRRSGVSFTKEQIDQVKALQASGDMMGAQAIVLGELEEQFGGAAEAANQGAGKAQKQWSDAVEDIQMSLAKGFLPLIGRVSDKMSELVADPAFMAGVESFGETLAGAFDAALNFAESIPWDSVGAALQLAGGGAKMAMDAFLSAPPWLQTAILTGWGLNKLTGGALGNLVGALGSGLIKGVLGMTAGVVNLKAGTVVGGGGGVGGGGKGGVPGIIPVAAAVVAGLQLGNVATSGMVAPTAAAATRQVQAVLDSGDAAAIAQGLGAIEDQLNSPDAAAQIALALDWNGVRSTLSGQRDALLAQLEEMGVSRTQAEALLAEQERTTAAQHSTDVHNAQAAGVERGQNNAALAAANRQKEASDRVREAVGSAREATNRGFSATQGLLGVLTRKNYSPIIKNNITVPVTLSTSVFVSASQVMQQVRRVQSATGGFSGFQEGTL